MTDDDADRVEAALRAAESRCGGQIVCVLARASGGYETPPTMWSAILALAMPWPLLFFTVLPAEWIFLVQLVVFVIALASLSAPAVRPRLTPAALRRSHAHRAALEQFLIRGLTHSAERNGVLIYVSLAERYARILADEGAAKAVAQREWRGVVDGLTGGLKRGDIADALIGAATSCGDLLAVHFAPREGAAQRPAPRFHMI